MAEEVELKDCNVTAELCFVGALFKKPDLIVNYSNFMRSHYDFSDPVTQFLYNSLELYYLKFSQTLDEVKFNTFMNQDPNRIQQYRAFKGWKTVAEYMSVADEEDIKNYYDTVKKYSLIREYGRSGFPVDKILSHKAFSKMTANDVYRTIRTKADKINTIINAGEEAVDITSETTAQVLGYLRKPSFGLTTPWTLYNELFLGLRKEKVMFEGFLSNEGKTRKLMYLAAYTALVQKQDFFFMSNEMSEEDLKSCLITTIVNNEEFQKLHGVKMEKCEKEIVLGVYRDRNGEIIRRKINDQGIYIEDEDAFSERVLRDSDELNNIIKVTSWLDDPNRKGKVYFLDVGTDYSYKRIEFELRKAKMVNNIVYYGYDTLKGFETDEWSAIKQFATKLKELTKELKMSGFAVFQLTDETVFTDVFSLSSNNIANAKQIKHVADILNIGKKISKDDYFKYQVARESNEGWGTIIENLDPEKQYFCIKPDKNRAGNKDKIMLFEINLDINKWKNIGYIIKRPKDGKK